MSSYTVTLNGNTSCLRSVLFPPIILREGKIWEAALLDFTVYNSIPNIKKNVNNKLHYYKDKSKSGELILSGTVELETGSYEIESINEELQRKMGKENIEISANSSLLKVEITSNYYIDFTQEHSLGKILGFTNMNDILEPNIKYTASDTVDIMMVNTINVTCNIIHGSYNNGKNEHILHTFYPNVPPGFKIVEKPHNLVYLPLNSSCISDIELNIVDQNGVHIDFRGEPISVRLHIRSTL